MGTTLIHGEGGPRTHVLIAGGGVAAIEALLALREQAGSHVEVELLAPGRELVYRPLLVAEPFGVASAQHFDLAEIAADQGARLRLGALGEVDAARHLVRTAAGEQLRYDALLVATGARALEALPGALTFALPGSVEAFRDLLLQLERRSVASVAFALADTVTWSLPLYELALLTARHLEVRGVEHAELTVATHERSPLELFGPRASEAVASLLADAGIGLALGSGAVEVEERALRLSDGNALAADRVVSVPGLEGPRLSGLPCDDDGFLPVDASLRVEGVEDVYAAGDATSHPVKQGGLATQQADAAASAIAAAAGADVRPAPFRPQLRAALLTGERTRYIRSPVAGGRSEGVDDEPLWWPPAKIAGRYLAPYLRRGRESQTASTPLTDLAVAGSHGRPEHGEHREAVELALTMADADAEWGDRAAALRWLEVVEDLDVAVPAEQARKRSDWMGEDRR